MLRILFFALLLLTGTELVLAGPLPNPETSRQWLLSLHAWAVPRYQHLRETTQTLSDSIDRACQSPPSSSAGKSLQTTWVEATRSWRELEALQLGPTLSRRSSRTIDFWPTRPGVIEQAALMTASAPASGPQADDLMQRWGTAAKGLPALEWFLFPEAGQAAPLWRSPAHCLYARRVAMGVASESAVLLMAWEREAARWPTATPEDVQRAIGETLNLMVGSCELLRGKKMQKGARVQAMGGPEGRLTMAFDAARSGNTRRFLLAHFDALAQLTIGRSPQLPYLREGPTVGLQGMLQKAGLSSEAAPLLPAVQSARRALSALPADPKQWTVARTDTAAAALRSLREVIDPPIARALQVKITFTDADGD